MNLTKYIGPLFFILISLFCNSNQTIDVYNSDIFYGNWTQIKSCYKGPPDHLSEIGYGELEINFVSESKWIQYINMGDSVECTKWSFFVRNDSLMRTPDELNYYYVGIISKSNDTLIIDKDYVTLWFVTYNSDKLPENWSKNIVCK